MFYYRIILVICRIALAALLLHTIGQDTIDLLSRETRYVQSNVCLLYIKTSLHCRREVLRPEGFLLLHTIGKKVEEPTSSWIKKYIFPGCHLPNLGTILHNARHPVLNFNDCENIRMHYSMAFYKLGESFNRNEWMLLNTPQKCGHVLLLQLTAK